MSHATYLEVVAKAPVAKHLKEGVVVGIFADVVQVVVLTASADTLLRVHSALHLGKVRRGVHRAEEDGLVLRLDEATHLVHTRVCEQKSRVIIGNGRARRHKGVTTLAEKVEERAAHLRGRPLDGRRRRRYGLGHCSRAQVSKN